MPLSIRCEVCGSPEPECQSCDVEALQASSGGVYVRFHLVYKSSYSEAPGPDTPGQFDSLVLGSVLLAVSDADEKTFIKLYRSAVCTIMHTVGRNCGGDINAWLLRILESAGKSWNLKVTFSRPGKSSWNQT